MFFELIVPFIVALFMALLICCELCVESVSTFERSSKGMSPGGWNPDWYLKKKYSIRLTESNSVEALTVLSLLKNLLFL